MNAHDNDRDSTPLAGLPHELEPPAGLEERVVARLTTRGMIARRPAWRWMAPLAAALAGLAIGWLLRGGPPEALPSVDNSELYLLLLSDDPKTDLSVPELVRIYSAWGSEQAALGRMAGAKKLQDTGVVIAAGPTGPVQPLEHDAMTPTGFFLVRAASLAEAEAIARTCPHVGFGGRVTVRPIDPV